MDKYEELFRWWGRKKVKSGFFTTSRKTLQCPDFRFAAILQKKIPKDIYKYVSTGNVTDLDPDQLNNYHYEPFPSEINRKNYEKTIFLTAPKNRNLKMVIKLTFYWSSESEQNTVSKLGISAFELR